jgi:hypothetical protein
MPASCGRKALAAVAEETRSNPFFGSPPKFRRGRGGFINYSILFLKGNFLFLIECWLKKRMGNFTKTDTRILIQIVEDKRS